MFCIVLSQEIKTKILIGLLFDNEIFGEKGFERSV